MRAHVARRRAALIDLVRERGTITVAELARLLGVHPMTVRRDLDRLAEQHRVERRHGTVHWPQKAVRPEPPAIDPAELTVGMIVPVLDYYFADLVRGARAVLADRGARMIIEVTDYDQARDARSLERLAGSGTDGLLFVPAGDATGIDDAAERAVLDRELPIVVVERCLPPGHPLADRDAVFADHAHGVGRALRFLVDRGRSRVVMMHRIALPGTRYLEGYLAGVDALGLRCPIPPLEAPGPDSESRAFAGAVNRLARLVRAGRVDAMIIQNDSSAIEVVSALLHRGIRIPRDLAVITYDDELAERCEVPLTAVSPPKRLVGTRAAELLLGRIADARARSGDAGYRAETSRRIGLLPELVQRRSTP